MLESQIVNNSLNIVDLVKAIKKEVLLEFAKEYVKKHVYVNAKKLSTAYLYERYDITYRDIEYIQISKTLSHKFRYTIMLLTQERLIVGYNNNGLYKRVELPKTDPETKNCTGTAKLIYYQGRFVNPKFYDLE